MFDFDKKVNRWNTGSIKYDVGIKKYHGNKDLIPLWIADTDFEVTPEVVEGIKKRCEHPLFGYNCVMPDYPKAITGWYERRHGVKLDPACVLPSFTVMTVAYFMVLAVTKPGDKILLMTPIYDPFYGVVANTGRVEVDSELKRVGDTYEIDFDDFEAKLKDGVKMVMLCNPHNPTGRVWTEQELKRLSDLCVKYNVYVSSDEVHGDIGLFGHKYTSMLKFQELHDKLVVFTAPSKTFNLAGMTISNNLIPNLELKTRVNESLRSAFIKTPNVLALAATQEAYAHGDAWVDEELQYLEGNSMYVQDYLREHMPKIGVTKHEGTFLMWLDFGCFGLGDKLGSTIVSECELALGAGGSYGAAYKEFMRLNIGTSRDRLAEALERLQKLYDQFAK